MGGSKNLIKRGLVRVADHLARFRSRSPVVVLCYHSVHPAKPFSSATPELFERHVRWLSQNCQVVDFERVFEAASRPKGDRPIVAITFDDGYADNYHFAFPVLKKFGLAATFFLTVGLLEQDPKVIARMMMLRNSAYDAIQPLEWHHVREMLAGGMTFGAHTYSHPNLALLNVEALRRELIDAKQLMEERMGASVTCMAYPFGKRRRHFDDRTIDVAREARYRYAGAVLFRSVARYDSPLAIPRIFVNGDTLATLGEKTAGSWDLVGWCQEKTPRWAAKRISPADFVE